MKPYREKLTPIADSYSVLAQNITEMRFGNLIYNLRIFDTLLVLCLVLGLAASCSSTPNTSATGGMSRFHALNVPDGSLRAGQVVFVATRQDIDEERWLHDTMTAAGIPDTDIRDGSIVITRVFCCGGPNEAATAITAYVPKHLPVNVGDIVEIWSGRSLKRGEPLGPQPNTVTRIVEAKNAAPRKCRWVPENEAMWLRVIHCDWMEAEGWQRQTGLYPVWVRSIGASAPPLSPAEAS